MKSILTATNCFVTNIKGQGGIKGLNGIHFYRILACNFKNIFHVSTKVEMIFDPEIPSAYKNQLNPMSEFVGTAKNVMKEKLSVVFL